MRSLLLVALTAGVAAAQAPPGTDIWLVPIERRDASLALGVPRNATARAGYDNQPSWSPRGDVVYFTSNRDGTQTDIHAITVATRAVTRVTRTPESEYSATPIDGGTALSVVRVEADSAQRLWRMPLNDGEPRVILANVRPVGYHAWVDERTLGLFVLGSPASLQIADVGSGATRTIAQGVGRGLARIPGSAALAYIEKVSDAEWWIMSYDPASGVLSRVAPTLGGVEDFAWTPDGRLLMARGSAVYAWNRARRAWDTIGDLGAAGVQGITRMAVSPDGRMLAIVARDSDD